jgi:multidrug efflux pump subunit AcrA (membrane-fusion protein)
VDAVVDGDPTYVDTATGTAPIRLRLRTTDDSLRPGMTGAVAIHPGTGRSAVVVPDAAVVYDGGRSVVLVESADTTWQPRPVSLGARVDGAVEIVAGVAAGERVATTGAASLLSAMRLPATAEEGD